MEVWNGRAIFAPFQRSQWIPTPAITAGYPTASFFLRGVSGPHGSRTSTSMCWNCWLDLSPSGVTQGIAVPCIFLRMDNVSVVRCVNHFGGTRSSTLARLASGFGDFVWAFFLDWIVGTMYAFPPLPCCCVLFSGSISSRHGAPLAFLALVCLCSWNCLLLARACFLRTSRFFGIQGGQIYPLHVDG